MAFAELRAAFRDLHGPRLHGFALVVAAGNSQRAIYAAADALAEANERVSELRHPERAAAWLRHRVIAELMRMRPTQVPSPERLQALSVLGIDRSTFLGLESLSIPERAALLAADMEQFSAVDVEQILGRSRNATRRLLLSGRRRFLAALADQVQEGEDLPGPMAQRIDEVAARTVNAGFAR